MGRCAGSRPGPRNQIRSIDKSRLVRSLGSLKPGTMARVDRALILSLGLVQL